MMADGTSLTQPSHETGNIPSAVENRVLEIVNEEFETATNFSNMNAHRD